MEASEEEKLAAKFRHQDDRPSSMHLQASRIVAANYRSHETGTKADLAKCLNSFQVSALPFLILGFVSRGSLNVSGSNPCRVKAVKNLSKNSKDILCLPLAKLRQVRLICKC